MTQEPTEVAVLLADITGSTPLYERAGDDVAQRQVACCLDGLRAAVERNGGTPIRSKGDDVLCFFGEAAAALAAAREMLAQQQAGPLGIHAGLHFGPIIRTEDDIYGSAVNLTARLAGLASPGEALLSSSFVERLPPPEAARLRFLDHIPFKGSSAATAVYSLQEGDATQHTMIMPVGDDAASAPVVAALRHGDRTWSCGEGETVSIGRSRDCDLVIERPWVSRQHALVSVRRGKVGLADRSSTGTYVTTGDGNELFLRRETMVLTGAGIISPATKAVDPRAEPIRYEIGRRPRSE